ncbi:hypothetical protein RZS08_24460, partial [Arthrospira platensis SPKY1]|nr:hypothetical protein [Arthrospira platensis SPKY1]
MSAADCKDDSPVAWCPGDLFIIGALAIHNNKLTRMSAKNTQLPGLNVYRALAVILMILAHAARVQTDMGTLRANPAGAGLFDWPLLGTLIIEPIISAMFLFIA